MPTSHLRWKVWKVEGFFVNLFPVASDSTEVPLSQAYGLPAQHKARPSGALKGSLIHKLANAASNKVTHLHKKAPEYQHYRYKQGQQPALASPRRTARYERIPPDGFGVAALEVKLHGKTPPPASLVPLVLSGPLCPAGISPPRGESPLSGEAYKQICCCNSAE